MIMTGNPDVLSRNNIFRELIKRYGVGDWLSRSVGF
jgi:hypothetical protein